MFKSNEVSPIAEEDEIVSPSPAPVTSSKTMSIPRKTKPHDTACFLSGSSAVMTLCQYYCYQVTLHQFGKSLQTYHLRDNEVDNDSFSSPPSPQSPAESPDTTTEARTEISLTPFLAEIDLEEKSVLNGKIERFKQLTSLCL